MIWGGCLVPLATLVYWFVRDDLTANPISFVTTMLGDWTLRILLASLAMTPLRPSAGPGLAAATPWSGRSGGGGRGARQGSGRRGTACPAGTGLTAGTRKTWASEPRPQAG